MSAVAGVVAGVALSYVLPATGTVPGRDALAIPIWLLAPFVLMLGCIALMPFVHARFWQTYYPAIALLLSGVVVGYYLLTFGAPGRHALTHAAVDYFQFIALIGSLYVVSSGVLIEIAGEGRPRVNTLLLASGAVLANIVGTTGASVLLIRPFLRLNAGRLRPFHISLFIMIVSNCGGCLTPIGDPPLFLGYLNGIPFGWTLTHLWSEWLFVNAALLTVFFILDSRAAPKVEKSAERCAAVSIRGRASLIVLPLLMLTVIFASELQQILRLKSTPSGAILQIVLAAIAYKLTDKNILKANGFNWHPVEEVAYLFVGIFATMAPALAFLDSHAAQFGLTSPTHYYFATGALSGVLDNAPTYLSFLQTAFGASGVKLAPENVEGFLAGSGNAMLRAISLGAVFFGAMTYVGNGPNFMVKAIAEADQAPVPSFFGYLTHALLILVPILVVTWALFLR